MWENHLQISQKIQDLKREKAKKGPEQSANVAKSYTCVLAFTY